MTQGFKKSTIEKILNNKISSWIDSITDSDVKLLAERDTIVTGGAIASLLMGDTPNDYDIYFKTYETALAISKYYVETFNAKEGKLRSLVKDYNPTVVEKVLKNIRGEEEKRILIQMKSAGIAAATEEKVAYEYFENKSEADATRFVENLTGVLKSSQEVVEELVAIKPKEYLPVFLSDNAISLSGKVQLVIRFFGEPSEIHKNYDYVHTTCFYTQCDRKVTLNVEALESIMSKSLVYNGSLYPIASVFRMRKFLSRGWRITAGQQLKMIWQISELDLSNREVLNDQLLGVDQAYMHQLIAALKNATGKVDATYVAKIIDDIFE